MNTWLAHLTPPRDLPSAELEALSADLRAAMLLWKSAPPERREMQRARLNRAGRDLFDALKRHHATLR